MKKIILLTLLISSNLWGQNQDILRDTIHWSNKPLNFSDFKGTEIDIPNITGEAYITIEAFYEKPNAFSSTETTVWTVFNRKNSWLNHKQQTPLTLLYYQVMFNIYEVYARQIKQELKNTKLGLNPTKKFNLIYNQNLTVLYDRLKQFSIETKMGTDNEAINKWDILIKRELEL